MMTRSRAGSVLGGVLAALLLTPAPSAGQLLEETGTVATGLMLRQLDGVKRVLMIGAHPDDEDTGLLTTMARGWGAETAYLSLTRGDGGQNLIGPELWEGLGIVRTGELLAARRLDGGQQFFTRAFDYGFSKSADEALSFWPREELLSDVVWVIRAYRPDVVVSVWSGTPADGHGQHQASGILAREAFEAAGDPERFPDQLLRGVEAWTPSKLFMSARRRFSSASTPADDGSIEVEMGTRDPLLGRSYYQLSMASRSQHRSQDMGSPQPPGPRETGVTLAQSRVGDGAGIFSGIDTTLVGLAGSLSGDAAAEAQRHLAAYRASLQEARSGFGVDPEVIVPSLVDARHHLVAAREVLTGAGPMPSRGSGAAGGMDRGAADGTESANGDAGGADGGMEGTGGGSGRSDSGLRAATADNGEGAARILSRRLELLDRTIMAAAGVSLEVRSADDLVVPGQTLEVSAQLWNGGRYTLTLPESVLGAPEGWRIDQVSAEGLTQEGSLPPGGLATWTYALRLPDDARLSRLYYLEEPRQGAMYRWPDDPELWGLPRDPPPVAGEARFGITGGGLPDTGERIGSRADWRYVGVDPASGEFHRPVLVVPAVSVSVSPSGVAWPQSRDGARSVSVVVRAESEGGASGVVSVAPPRGWTVTPARRAVELDEAGAERVMSFDVRPERPLTPGRYTFDVAFTTDEGRRYDEGYDLIDYEHIDRAAYFSPARATVSVIPVALPEGLRVGYIMGSGDDGPEAIRQMGADVELLDDAQVREGDFDRFSTVVLGVRAYETRPDLQAAASQLLDFARGGGTVIVQYNRGPLGSLAPYEIEVGRGSPRVADETAPVEILDPSAPLFTTPNRITEADFEGWVQERGLYFASEWGDAWVPVLQLHDPGEEPRFGSVLAATVGEGVFVYTGLSFFRQWADQVPGAYRLFANLISLDPEAWRAYRAGR